MQQVKKQLQDAIKKLKSDWGINEVKREDLAAVLEKVVAAVERAAQLPAQPAQPEYVGGVIVAVKIYSDEYPVPVESINAPSNSIPAVYGSRGSNDAQLLMYSPYERRMYTWTNEGNPVSFKYRNHVILCGDTIVTFERDENGQPLGLRFFGSSPTFTNTDTQPHPSTSATTNGYSNTLRAAAREPNQ